MFAAFLFYPIVRSIGTVSTENDPRWEMLFARKLQVEAVEAFGFFRARGIEPILIKGWAAARNYPPGSNRFYSDVDLAVAPELFDAAKAAMAPGTGAKIGVDLHRGLRHLDTKPWEQIFADSEVTELEGSPVRIPCAEDHLRIMAVHWLNDGAEREDRLWDIYHAIANRPANFDWDKCLNAVPEHRRYWIIATVGLAAHFLGLELEGLPFKDEAADLPPWLINAVRSEWRLGVRQRSLHTCLRDPKEFARQLRKRLPPNPIQATIDVEGDLRRRFIFPYQLKSFHKRLWPSLRGVTTVLRSGKDE